jgi:transposase
MNEKNPEEIDNRRKLFQLFDKGKSVAQILKLIPRSRPWVYKWKQRFEQKRWQALDSFSKAPHGPAHQYAQKTINLVLRLRERLKRSSVGLLGARSIRRELKRCRLLRKIPSLSTINRWLKQAGAIEVAQAREKKPYYPEPKLPEGFVLQSCDWTARWLAGGEKPYVIHTIEAQTHALCQTISADKSTDSIIAHILEAFTLLGLPDFLQIDNDGAFTNLGHNKSVFRRFIRLMLYLGIELVFIPKGEPKRNYLVEGINHLWSQAFFDKDHFTSIAQLKRKSPKFFSWYEVYEPPLLGGLSIKAARRGVKCRRLKSSERRRIPDPLPLTEGRVHFIRRVNEQGEITILNQRWKVSKQLVGEYVWATVFLKEQSLKIFYRRSERAMAKLIKQYDYPVDEPVERLLSQYRRRQRRVNVLMII